MRRLKSLKNPKKCLKACLKGTGKLNFSFFSQGNLGTAFVYGDSRAGMVLSSNKQSALLMFNDKDYDDNDLCPDVGWAGRFGCSGPTSQSAKAIKKEPREGSF